MDAASLSPITPNELSELLRAFPPPTVVVVRSAEALAQARHVVPLSHMFAEDLVMLRWGMLVYDALYAWCRQARGETHGWDPARIRAQQRDALRT
jgi:hypothetical protein